MLHALTGIAACLLLFVGLSDAAETIVLARRARRIFRLTDGFYAITWTGFSYVARKIESSERRERFLGVYGPTSLLALLALWALMVIVAFGLLYWALGVQFERRHASFGFDLIYSAGALTTMTLDTPTNRTPEVLTTIEAGLGFALLGLVVGYLPVLYQSFADRERHISLLDSRAGSPPAASEFILRQGRHADRLEKQLASWEEWASNLLEMNLSYPMLAYFRSRHQNQSWLSSLVTIIDASAITILCGEGALKNQAKLTFAMGRHALADFVTIFRQSPPKGNTDRLPAAEFGRLHTLISAAETALDVDRFSEAELAKLRQMYEPFAVPLSEHFLMALPGWLPTESERDNWLRSSWDRNDGPYAVSDPFQRQ